MKRSKVFLLIAASLLIVCCLVVFCLAIVGLSGFNGAQFSTQLGQIFNHQANSSQSQVSDSADYYVFFPLDTPEEFVLDWKSIWSYMKEISSIVYTDEHTAYVEYVQKLRAEGNDLMLGVLSQQEDKRLPASLAIYLAPGLSDTQIAKVVQTIQKYVDNYNDVHNLSGSNGVSLRQVTK